MKRALPGFVIYALMGAAGTAAHYSVLVVGVAWLARDAVATSVFGACVGAVINYGLNYRITFGSVAPHWISAPRFFLVAALGILLNGAGMYVLVAGIGIHYLAAQVIVTAAVLAVTYTINSVWTFRFHR